MATDHAANTLIRDLILDVRAQEPKVREKANTVTAVIGTVVTTVLGIATLLLQSGLDLPEWSVFVVLVAGMVATDLGISKTKNGMTDSTATRLEEELSKRIDLNHDHTADLAEIEPVQHTNVQELLVEAKRLAATDN